MTRRLTARHGFLLAGSVALFIFGVAAAAQTKTVLWPAEAIKWIDNPAVPGAKQAVLWGDPTKGAYGALKQVPGGTVLAAHTHSHDSKVVMVKGSISFEIEGKTTVLNPGSFASIPANVGHSATCRGTVACEYFEEMAAAFDSTPVKK